MTPGLPVYPFDQDRYIGTVTEIGPATAKVNLPKAAAPDGQWLHGFRVGAGEVGEFVFIECGESCVFGRLIYVKLPERERLTVEAELGVVTEAHPLGTVQMLATVMVKDGRVISGIPRFPRLGARVYSAHPTLVKWVAEAVQRTEGHTTSLTLEIACIPAANDTVVQISPGQLFGRHCAVLGTTGGGKSWTLARLLEEASRYNAKLVLLDATGEFHTLRSDVQHIQIGKGDPMPADCVEAAIPHTGLTEHDLMAMFRPSGQTQVPKLRAAIKSLKLARVLGKHKLVSNGAILKAGILKAEFDSEYRIHAKTVEDPATDIDITKLCEQVQNECVFPSANYGKDPTKFGDASGNDVSYCVGLLSRIEDMIRSPELACVFNAGAKTSFAKALDEFQKDSSKKCLRVSLKYLPSAHDAREIIANVIGRCLLDAAKKGTFQKQPVVVFLDEAHQFLNKALGDEYTRYPLDAFELIAKEGRKFSLTICLATQRPRDIPEGVLSQVGTLIVHRLINERDREVVEKSSGEIDRSAAAFLPTLAPGEAVIVGADFPIPLTVQMFRPKNPPDSKGPDYESHWRPPTKPDAKPKGSGRSAE
jgi:uncharacterized protein